MFDVEEGSKVKSDIIQRSAAHDFLYVGLISQTSRHMILTYIISEL